MKCWAIQILKALNAIRGLSVIIFVVITAQCLPGQNQLNGRFTGIKPMQEHYEYFVFSENSSFEYYKGASLGNDFFGKGKYHIANKVLKLNFCDTPPKSKPYYTDELWDNKSDSISLIFEVRERNGEPIGYTNVILDEMSELGTILDVNGRGKLKLKRIEDNYNLTVSFIEHDIIKIRIDGRYSHCLKVFLTKEKGQGIPIRNYKEEFIIHQLSDSLLILENSSGEIRRWVNRK